GVFGSRILGEIRWRTGKVRIGTKHSAEIGGHGCAVRLRDSQVANAVRAVTHQGDAVLPAFFIATNRGNLGLESMATHASEKQQLFASAFWQQNLPFVNGKIGPSDRSLLESDIQRYCLF